MATKKEDSNKRVFIIILIVIIILALVTAYIFLIILKKPSLGPEFVEIPISGCMELNQPNTIYILENGASSGGTCFTITADGVTLNGMGNSILNALAGNLGSGIDIRDRKNINVHNFTVYNYNNGKGIYIQNSSEISVYNASFFNNKYGIYFLGDEKVRNY